MVLTQALMPFLRPLGPPQSSSVHQFMRRISSSTRLYNQVQVKVPLSAPTPAPAATVSEPYFVHRTPSRQLPIYTLAKRGGNLHQTKIRKVEGDVKVLRDQLQQALQLDSKDITINSLTKHIIVKGWRKSEITKFLEQRRF
ncbi:hypothetical protein L228DRAFT_269329 [Xylona heveae TC161]|uniref:Large ribosomal subunit protein mL49 n=1 Tax=Xylona heveae (strain CBS 132557 / TC161) TaxID=1328760 RepID=A0A165G8T9_XYLHT|nr:hypothetical protein L228DRAFT_269329 [Xylona heveae TC161]KZF21880.1 hypothetical protein L228DRAFT_269329 [Xylona heveae TC161]